MNGQDMHFPNYKAQDPPTIEKDGYCREPNPALPPTGKDSLVCDQARGHEGQHSAKAMAGRGGETWKWVR